MTDYPLSTFASNLAQPERKPLISSPDGANDIVTYLTSVVNASMRANIRYVVMTYYLAGLIVLIKPSLVLNRFGELPIR